MEAELNHLISDMLWTATKVTAPILLVALSIGVLISLVQTVVQVQEATLTFVPKLMGIAIVIAVGGDWMLLELGELMDRALQMIPVFLAS
ncbi:MAG: flagellar biosynthetic protein FliQ [Acidimicrobiales bacterium]